MAKDKNKDKFKELGVYRDGDKYYCIECNTELLMHKPCPTCDAQIDWERLQVMMRR